MLVEIIQLQLSLYLIALKLSQHYYKATSTMRTQRSIWDLIHGCIEPVLHQKMYRPNYGLGILDKLGIANEEPI